MKKVILILLILTQNCWSQNLKRKLIWQENFNATKLDDQIWNFELGDGCPNICGWGNNEKQIYTNKNHKLLDGKLIIQATKDGNGYTSTRITTKDKK